MNEAHDPALEARATRLAAELRCLVCQNQTLGDSHAGLALDLKRALREQVRAGRSDAEVLDYMAQRYGDFVLYRPPLKATTAALWFGPFALLGVGAAVHALVARRQRLQQPPRPLSDAERARAAALLGERDGGGR
jgi:cytochrome c-type biogenesis protein CcmH